MTISEAFNLLALNDQASKAEIKKAYKIASVKYHPDKNPTNDQVMVAINAAYAFLKGIDSDPIVQPQDSKNYDFAETLQSVLAALSALDGLTLEVCGNWLWIGGNTFTHKTAIKAAGCLFSKKKSMWFFRPEEYKSSSRRSHSIDEIRERHGSQIVKTTSRALVH